MFDRARGESRGDRTTTALLNLSSCLPIPMSQLRSCSHHPSHLPLFVLKCVANAPVEPVLVRLSACGKDQRGRVVRVAGEAAAIITSAALITSPAPRAQHLRPISHLCAKSIPAAPCPDQLPLLPSPIVSHSLWLH